MRNHLTLNDIETVPIGELAALPPAELKMLLDEAEALTKKAKLFREWLEGAVNLKYQLRIDAQRRTQDKPYGVVHIEDDGHIITCDLPKKPEWDQAQLAVITQNIQASGDNAAEYVETSYRISERKFSAWPEHIRQAFEKARTVRVGKPTYAIKQIEGGQP